MKWERAPYFSISNSDNIDFSSGSTILSKDGVGFLAGYIFDREDILRIRDFRKVDARHKSLIQKTEDDWKTRTTVFEGRGEIEGLYRVGEGQIVARNTQVNGETLASSTQFLTWTGEDWKEIANLAFRVVEVYGSDGPWLLAVGYPQEGFDTVYSFVSSDGAKSWRAVDLHGFNPAEFSVDTSSLLSHQGKLYRLTPATLDILDLNILPDTATWLEVARPPNAFKKPHLFIINDSIFTIGELSDHTFGIWNMRLDGKGPNAIQECHGIPKEFSIDKFVIHGTNFYLAGFVPVRKDGEMRGLEHHVLRSKQNGTIWEDLKLPITGGLNAVDFGSDGRIWAIAPGNRIQIWKE